MSIDLIIRAPWVVTCDAQHSVIEDGAVAVAGTDIVAVDAWASIADQASPTTRVQHLSDHIVLPGLVNAHGHAAMTLLRGAADDMALHDWLNNRIWPLEGALADGEFVRRGTQLAAAEMLLSGTTAFSDMYFFPEEAAAAATGMGLRMQAAVPIFDMPMRWAAGIDECLHKALELRDQTRANDRLRVVFGPHAPWSVSADGLRRIATYAEELDTGIHMHVAETAQDAQLVADLHGTDLLGVLGDTGLLSPRLQAVHTVHLTDREIEAFATSGVRTVHCPASNLKLGSGLARVSQMRGGGLSVAIGTDGAASNNNLDMFREMYLAALLAKGSTLDAATLPANEALTMATREGATTIGFPESGSLAAGQRADIIAVATSAPAHLPMHDPVSHLVYAASGRDVTHVWTDGTARVADGTLLDVDLAELRADAAQWRNRVAAQ